MDGLFGENLKGYQFQRTFNLIVFNNSTLDGLDISKLKIKFDIIGSEASTPNSATIRVYNLSSDTVAQIDKEFKRVVLQAGYAENTGVIFKGNIKQIIRGRESGVDTYIDIFAGDGDQAYNFAIVNKTLDGASHADVVGVAAKAMTGKDDSVTMGPTPDLSAVKLPRGKVMYGKASTILKNTAETNDASFSIQQGKITIIPKKEYLPGERVVLTYKTGMLGTPTQTTEGVNIKCLLNPNIKIGGQIQIDNASVEQMKIAYNDKGTSTNTPSLLSLDGVYYVQTIRYVGDTRGNDWYCDLKTLLISTTSNPRNAVQPGFGE